jgi:hypothetical protein
MATHNITPLSRPTREHETYAVETQKGSPTALCVRPDTDSIPIEAVYPAPSYSEGIFQALNRHLIAYFQPVHVGQYHLPAT